MSVSRPALPRSAYARSQIASRSRDRMTFALLALLHALACRWMQEFVFYPVQAWAYMGVKWYDASFGHEVLALFLATAPAFAMPLRLTRAPDLAVLILYGGVYIPSVAMQPNLTILPFRSQMAFLSCTLIGLLVIRWISQVDFRKTSAVMALKPKTFDAFLYGLAILTLVMYGAFTPVQSLVFDFSQLYARRAEFFSEADQLPWFMRYLFVNVSLALAPLMVARGVHHRKIPMIVLALVLAYLTFITTSLRSMLFSVAFVGAVSVMTTWRRPIAVSLFLFFLGIAVGCLALDAILPGNLPEASYGLHFRLFGNAGLLSDAYHAYFDGAPKVLYSQSFMRMFLQPPINAPYQVLVGESVSDVAGNHANGNYVADAFANLGYFGIIVVSAVLGGIFLFYQRLSAQKDLTVAALGLAAVGFYLTNAGVHSALLSGGLVVSLILIAAYPVASEDLIKGRRGQPIWTPNASLQMRRTNRRNRI